MLYLFFQNVVGMNAFSFVSLGYMIIRGVIIYFLGITLARFNKKLLGIRTPFNFILFIMLGSIFANAIVDVKLFLPIIATVVVLTLLNGCMTMLSFYFPSVELFIKGESSVLLKDGIIQWNAMGKNFITERELLNELHAQLHTQDLQDVKSAILASDGTINFIKKN